ncbi:MAG: 30S ribosome-binding factor RbfA [Candidatus Bipolaricaulota bacterium]|nr:30S ribosome-binding factor RbfA [Candidatus Bipolaricaulota bacterium]
MSRWGFARLQEEIHHRLSEILQFEARDPRLERVTIFSVKLSKDAHHAWVSVGVLSDSPEEESESLDALREHRGFLRTALAKLLRVRHTPELHFALEKAERSAQ